MQHGRISKMSCWTKQQKSDKKNTNLMIHSVKLRWSFPIIIENRWVAGSGKNMQEVTGEGHKETEWWQHFVSWQIWHTHPSEVIKMCERAVAIKMYTYYVQIIRYRYDSKHSLVKVTHLKYRFFVSWQWPVFLRKGIWETNDRKLTLSQSLSRFSQIKYWIYLAFTSTFRSLTFSSNCAQSFALGKYFIL